MIEFAVAKLNTYDDDDALNVMQIGKGATSSV